MKNEKLVPVSGRFVDRQKYNALVAAYRDLPKNYSRAAHLAGVTRPTAKRAWSQGWPARNMPAIKDVLEEERILTRSRRRAAIIEANDPDLLERLDEEEGADDEIQASSSGAIAAQMLAKDDAVESRLQESRMVALSRANTIALMSSTSRLLSAAIDKAKQLELQIKMGEVNFTPKETQRFIGSLGYLVSKATESAKLTIEMERLLLGEPTEIIGMDIRNMSLDDAARTIELANRALARARKKGLVPPAEVIGDALQAVAIPSLPERGKGDD